MPATASATVRLAIAAAVLVPAACREYHEPSPARKAPPVEAASAGRPVATPTPPPKDRALDATAVLAEPVRDGRLELVPIIATAPRPASRYVTLVDGMRQGSVSVREVGHDWQVDTVLVSNQSHQPLFAMTGEVIVEGHQDRVLAESVIIAPGETERVHVRCVEPGREHGSMRFVAGGALGDVTLRRTVRHGSQSEVWSHVRGTNRRLSIASESDTYRMAAARQLQGEAAARRDRITATLAARPDRSQMVGLAVALDGEVIAIDRFVSPALYAQLEPELIASYLATEGADGSGTADPTDPDDIRALAQSATETTAASFESLRPVERTPIDPTPRD